MKFWTRWNISWNQDLWEKYQYPQIFRRPHPYGRKLRRTKETLDEGEEESEKVGLKLSIQNAKIMGSGPITSWQIGEETMRDFIFLCSRITADHYCSHEIQRRLLPWKKSYDKSIQHIKKQRNYFANKGPYSQSYNFSSSHVRMWDLDHKESWVLKNWWFWTVVERLLRVP